MLFQSLQSVLVIILIIALGYILQQKKWFGEDFPTNISRLITDIALPASVFSSVLKYLSKSELLSLGSSLIYSMGSVASNIRCSYCIGKGIESATRTTWNIYQYHCQCKHHIYWFATQHLLFFGENSMPYFLVYYVTNTVSTLVL